MMLASLCSGLALGAALPSYAGYLHFHPLLLSLLVCGVVDFHVPFSDILHCS